VGHRAGLDNVERRKFFILPRLELGPLGRPARSQSLSRLLLVLKGMFRFKPASQFVELYHSVAELYIGHGKDLISNNCRKIW
jgi:hypothetical protein